MPKQSGSLQRFRQQTPEDIILQTVEDLDASGDSRFQRFFNYKPLPALMEWWASTKKVNAIAGANRSGKSTSGIVKAIMVYTGIIPDALQGVYPWHIPRHRPRRVVLVVQDYTKHWPLVLQQMLLSEDMGMLPRLWSGDYDPQEHTFYGPDGIDGEPRTGSFLSVIACDPSIGDDVLPTQLRGPQVDHALADEITTRAVFTELVARSAAIQDGPGTVDYVYCPQEGTGKWDYKEIYGASYDLRTNRRLPPEKQHPQINCVRISMRDNPSITPENLQKQIDSYRDHERAYRVEGMYSDHAESPFFNMDMLYDWERSGRLKEGAAFECVIEKVDVETGEFTGKMQPSRLRDFWNIENLWQVWEEPIPGETYLLTLDAGEGKKKDWHSADVWRISHERKIDSSQHKPVQVAQFHKNTGEPDVVADMCGIVANWYGGCLLAFERNNTCGGTVYGRLHYYPNCYRRAKIKDDTISEDQKIGWFTDAVNKPEACHNAKRIVEDWKARFGDFCGLNSIETLYDILAFEDRIILGENGRRKRLLAAKKGSHDDCVTSLWIMAYILTNQKYLLTPMPERSTSRANEYISPLEQKAAQSAGRTHEHFPHLTARPSMREIMRPQQAARTKWQRQRQPQSRG